MVYGHPGAVMELVPLAVNHHQPLAVPTAVQEHVTTRHLSMTARNVPAVPRHLLNVHRKAIAQVIIWTFIYKLKPGIYVKSHI